MEECERGGPRNQNGPIGHGHPGEIVTRCAIQEKPFANDDDDRGRRWNRPIKSDLLYSRNSSAGERALSWSSCFASFFSLIDIFGVGHVFLLFTPPEGPHVRISWSDLTIWSDDVPSSTLV